MTALRRHCLPAALLAGVAVLSFTSAALAVGEPVNESPPVVTASGLELTTTDGEWTGQMGPFLYEWLRCSNTFVASCSPLAGEESPTYTLRRGDIGTRIRSRVTAANVFGSASAPSAEVGPVAEELFPAPEPEPEPDSRPALLRPKPVVAIEGSRRGRLTFITEFSVSGPAGAIVRLRCRGRGCPIRRLSTRIGARNRLRLRRAQRTYRAGNVLVVQVVDEDAERVGKYTRLSFRDRGRIPLRADSCLQPGESTPSPCP